MPELSVVIPTYRRRDALPRTLDALERQTVGTRAFEVLVIDDPVEDDSEAVARDVDAGRRPYAVRHLHRDRRGVSAARNAGWQAADAELVMFIGDDILAAPDLLARHLALHRVEPGEETGVLGRVVWARELKVTPFMQWLDRGYQFDYGALRGGEAPWTHLYTSNVSLKRSLLERIGGFDEERFPFLYEDLDAGRRLSEHGLRLLYEPGAIAEHLHPTGVDDWRRRMAATAAAERRWITTYPDMPAWFHDRFERAAARPRIPPLLGHAAARLPSGTPGARAAHALADLHFRQELAPAFLDAWRRATADARR